MPRLILPGWHGSGPQHWQRHWAARDPGARVVEQDDWANPDLERWLARLDNAVVRAGAPVTFIAHSLGTALVAHYVSRYPNRPVRGALLVAPGDVDLHAATEPVIAGFGPLPRERLPFPAILVVSRNDALMAYDRAVALGRDWGAQVIDLGDAGHINVDSGYGPWPEALRWADEIEALATAEATETNAAGLR